MSASVHTLAPSAARTSSGTGETVAMRREGISTLNVLVNVTAISGTSPSLDVALEWSIDGTNFASVTAALSRQSARRVPRLSPSLYGPRSCVSSGRSRAPPRRLLSALRVSATSQTRCPGQRLAGAFPCPESES